MARIAIAGAGDLGQLLARHIRTCVPGTVAGFFDDTRTAGTSVLDAPLLGRMEDIEASRRRGDFDELLIGVGYRHFDFRKSLYERLAGSVPFATFVHPSAWVDPTATIAPGTAILPGSVIDAGVTLEANVLINVGTIVAHDSTVGAHSFLAPGVRVAGFVLIGECTFLGIGTTVIDGLVLCPRTQTGAGAVIVKSTDEPGLYLGVPAKRREARS